MPSNAATDLEALKAAHPILDVARALGLAAVHHRIRCPRPENHAHGDRTPSVTVWPDRGTFKCWVCPDVRGDVIDLIRLVKGCTFREALDFLRGTTGVASPLPTRAEDPSDASRARAGGPAGRVRAAQTEMFASGDASPAPSSTGAAPAKTLAPASSSMAGRAPSSTTRSPAPNPAVRSPASPSTAARSPAEDDSDRRRVLAALLDLCPPVGGKHARYLQKRRIFKRTWDAQRIRMIEDYPGVGEALRAAFDAATLERAGVCNAAGHLRFYRHTLLFPYFDRAGDAVYLQARTIDPKPAGPKGPLPKELSLAGPIPLPYNAHLLDESPGHLYLCEGVIDTLTLLEQGFAAVGVPGASNFKAAWAPLFHNKTVHVAFDPDAAGDAGAARALDLLIAAGVDARRFTPPGGMDLNDWFRKG